MGGSASDVGSVVEEEDVDPREADEGVDVEEEDAIEEGYVHHFGCGVDNHWAFRIFCLVQDMRERNDCVGDFVEVEDRQGGARLTLSHARGTQFGFRANHHTSGLLCGVLVELQANQREVAKFLR